MTSLRDDTRITATAWQYFLLMSELHVKLKKSVIEEHICTCMVCGRNELKELYFGVWLLATSLAMCTMFLWPLGVQPLLGLLLPSCFAWLAGTSLLFFHSDHCCGYTHLPSFLSTHSFCCHFVWEPGCLWQYITFVFSRDQSQGTRYYKID
jgi:hypothetical protein